jgi:hypothetical protein
MIAALGAGKECAMKQVILLFVTILAYATASDTIRPLFETSSIAEYDRWLWQHRNEYPRFRPVRVLVGEERSGSGWTRLTAVFLTDSGTELVRHVYPDSWQGLRIQQVSNINVTEAGDYSVVYRRGGGGTVYDRYGRELFDGAPYPRFNLWFRDISGRDANAHRHPWSEGVRESDSTQVLNDRGEVVGVLPRVSAWTATASGDTLMAAVTGGTVVFDRSARIRWRDAMFGTAPRVAAISPNGRKVAVITSDSVGLHDMVTGSTKALGLHPETATRLRITRAVWSDDSRRIAVYRTDWDVVDTALLWTFSGDGKGSTKPRRLSANAGDQPFWAGSTVLLIASPYFTDSHWRAAKQPTPGPSRVMAVAPRGLTRTWFVKGVFQWNKDWYQQGRRFAYVDKSGGHAVVFEVPIR